MLAALLAGALLSVAGCGGDSGGSSKDPSSRCSAEGGLRENVRAAQHVKASDFPSADGKTLQQIAEEVKGGGSVEAGLASSVFTVGDDAPRVRRDRRARASSSTARPPSTSRPTPTSPPRARSRRPPTC